MEGNVLFSRVKESEAIFQRGRKRGLTEGVPIGVPVTWAWFGTEFRGLCQRLDGSGGGVFSVATLRGGNQRRGH